MNNNDCVIRQTALFYMLRFGLRYLTPLFLVPLLVAYVVWDRVPTSHTVCWTVLQMLSASYRLFLLRKARTVAVEDINVRYWSVQSTATAVFSGILWGSAPILFFVPDSAGIQVFIFGLLYALIAVSLTLHSYWISAYFGFVVPVSVGLMLALTISGSTEYYAFAVLTPIYAAVFFKVAFDQRRMIYDSFRLRLENVELLRTVSQQKEAAEQASQEKSHFLAAASHDIRQPLNAIGLFCDTLSDQTDSATSQDLICSIRRAVTSLDQLLISLLDISKLDAGVVEARPVAFALADIVDRIAAEFRVHAASKGLEWQCTHTGYTVYTDKVFLESILRNLLSNAIRYTNRGTVEMLVRRESHQIIITVRDTGIGVAPEYHEEIFNEFVQLSNLEHSDTSGVGLGLSIVNRLCRLQAIPLTFTSTPGQGTSITLAVPEGRLEAGQTVPVNTNGLIASAGSDACILIIQNFADGQKDTEHQLTAWGYRVITAASVKQALEILDQGIDAPDLVLAAIRLEKESEDLSLIEILRAKYDTVIATIIITGDTSEAATRCLHDSGHRVLYKPVSAAKLRAAIISALKERRSIQSGAIAQSFISRE